MTTRRWFCLAMLALAGCGRGDGKPLCHPVRGSLYYNGQPAKGAVVTLHPLPLSGIGERTVRPQSGVSADGTFHLHSHGSRDGAAAGEYAATVFWTSENGGPDYLKGRHSDPTKPVLTVTIGPGDNELPPIKLNGPAIVTGRPEID